MGFSPTLLVHENIAVMKSLIAIVVIFAFLAFASAMPQRDLYRPAPAAQAQERRKYVPLPPILPRDKRTTATTTAPDQPPPQEVFSHNEFLDWADSNVQDQPKWNRFQDALFL